MMLTIATIVGMKNSYVVRNAGNILFQKRLVKPEIKQHCVSLVLKN